jgi:hypothetical protein
MAIWIEGVAQLLETAVDAIFRGSSRKSRPERNEEPHMPLVQIEDLPDSSRTWVFGADRDLGEGATDLLLREVDRFLSQWHAHGAPLIVGRDWKYGRFLTVAVDQSTAGASGCSIDGLFRSLKAMEPRLGASLVTSGQVFYRGKKGAIQCVARERFTALSAEGKIGPRTRVFDPTVTTLGEWRARFELDAAESWHSGLLHDKQPA